MNLLELECKYTIQSSLMDGVITGTKQVISNIESGNREGNLSYLTARLIELTKEQAIYEGFVSEIQDISSKYVLCVKPDGSVSPLADYGHEHNIAEIISTMQGKSKLDFIIENFDNLPIENLEALVKMHKNF